MLAGDFYADPVLQRRGRHGSVLSVWGAFAHAFRWVIGVAGNHDAPDALTPGALVALGGGGQAHLLDGDTVALDGLRVGGVSGIIGQPRKPFRKEQADLTRLVDRVLKSEPSVLLLHQGPDVPSDDLPGCPVLYERLKARREVLVICGHMHWDAPLAVLPGGSQVLNVDGRAILLSAARTPGR